MQSNEQQIHLMYEVSNDGNMMMYNEEAMQGQQEHFNGTSLDVKDKKPPRRYLSAQEEECLFEIWGRDNWRLTQPGKNMAIFNKWSQELKDRFDVDLKPLEIQTKVNANRLKFRQVLKQCATDKTAFKKWKNFHVVGKILSNQYRSLDAEEISPEDLKKNRDMVFIESMTGFLNEANTQGLEESTALEKDETPAVENQATIVKNEDFFATHNDNNGTTVNTTELNQILVAHDPQQNQQLYHYLQQQQQQQQHLVVIPQAKTEEQLIVNAQQQQQQTHDTDYYEDTLEQQQQQQQQQQQPQEQLIHLQQQAAQQNMQLLQAQQQHDQQYADTINTYLSLSQAQAHVSVIQTNQTQQEVQPQQQQQQQQQIQYQQSIMLPLQHQAPTTDEQTLFVKPTTPAPLAPIMQQYLDPNQVWDSQKVVTSPLLQTKRTYRSRTSNTKQTNQHHDIKDKINQNNTDDKMMMMNTICANQAQAQVAASSTSEFSASKKRRISSIANSKEILKFREDWLKQQDIKTKQGQKDESLFQQQEIKASEVVSNTSLKGATEVEMLYLAEVCRRNEIMAEQRNISSKLLRLEERKVALMESFFPKCFKLQEEFLERTLNQSSSKKKNNKNVKN